MKVEEDDSQKLLWGLIIGGAIGAGAIYYMYSVKTRETPVLKKIGRTLTDVGQMLENCEIQNGSDVIHKIEEKLPKTADIAHNLTDWLESGLSIWNKVKRG